MINHNLVHGSTEGGDDRRLLSFNFWEEIPSSETNGFLKYLCQHSSLNVETVLGPLAQNLSAQNWGIHCTQVKQYIENTWESWNQWNAQGYFILKSRRNVSRPYLQCRSA